MTDALMPDDPTEVGAYKVVARLGVGGMGTVYLAQNSRGAPVALKVIHRHLLADRVQRDRFVREVGNAVAVSSPHTAAVLDADLTANPPYMVTEYVPGRSLRDHVATQGPFEPQALLALAAALAQGLAAIHRHGIAHRDLTPANVLLDDQGPRIIDLGLAVTAHDTRLTGTGTAIGTPGWLAPERIVDGTAGTPADVYAWGLLVCFAATGTNPFGSGPAEALFYRVVHDAPTVPELPDRLQEAVNAALQRDSDMRPTATELLRALVDAPPDADDVTLLAATQRVATAVWPTVPVTEPLDVGETRPVRATQPTRTPAAATTLPDVPAPQPAGSWSGKRGWIAALVLIVAAGFAATMLAGNDDEPIATGSEVTTPTARDGGSAEPVAAAPSDEPAGEDEAASSPIVEETTSEPDDAPGRPGRPQAPWDTAPVTADTPDVVAVRDRWYDTLGDDVLCTLYAPTAMVTELGLELSYTEFTRIGDYQFGWQAPDGADNAVAMSVWPIDNQNVQRFFDEDPDGAVYEDGSVLRGEGFEKLLAVPGEGCFYEMSAESMVGLGWLLESLRPIAP